MSHSILEWIGTGAAAAGAGYAAIAAIAATQRPRLAPATPASCPVSVLKPLCGLEPGLYCNLRSFCEQDHPQFEIICGVRDPHDPAIGIVRRLQREFRGCDLRLIVNPTVHGTNLKVSNLINLLPHARHDHLVLADSDIRVERDYLRRVCAPLGDPQIGLVTCLYRAAPLGGAWTHFGSLYIDGWFAPSVRVAQLLGFRRFAFGATLALRRRVLEAAGGFGPLRDVLADDYWLGEGVRRLGLRTTLSEVVVSTDVTEGSAGALWNHEMRWMRTIAAVDPAGFTGLFVTFTFPMLLAGLALAPTAACLALVLAGAACKLVLHRAQGKRWATAALLPLRDFALLAEWLAAHAVSKVRWREQVLRAPAERQLQHWPVRAA